MLVEPACGAALSFLYNDNSCNRKSYDSGTGNGSYTIDGDSIDSMVSSSNGDSSSIDGDVNKKERIVVIVVCGGSVVNEELLSQWMDSYCH